MLSIVVRRESGQHGLTTSQPGDAFLIRKARAPLTCSGWHMNCLTVRQCPPSCAGGCRDRHSISHSARCRLGVLGEPPGRPKLRPDVVLADIMLGGESGFDLARRLAGHDRRGGAAVILISAYSEADFADLIAESPATRFLSKGELLAHAIRRIADGGVPAGPPGAHAC
jgi:CheY-like chemotaxis protein